MKKNLYLFALVLSILAIGSQAQTVQDGLTAYKQKDYETALRILTPLAEGGDAEAQLGVGNMHLFGRGVPQNVTQAIQWFQKSAHRGNVNAQNTLGVMYAFGRGVAQDFGEAVKWYRLAAMQRDALALHNLGMMYAQGRGVSLDYTRAYALQQLSIQQGDTQITELSKKVRDAIAERMTPAQIQEAEALTRSCAGTGLKDCTE